MITKKSLSIVIPFFNEEQELPLLFRDFIKFEKKNPNLIIEYLFINDGYCFEECYCFEGVGCILLIIIICK